MEDLEVVTFIVQVLRSFFFTRRISFLPTCWWKMGFGGKFIQRGFMDWNPFPCNHSLLKLSHLIIIFLYFMLLFTSSNSVCLPVFYVWGRGGNFMGQHPRVLSIWLSIWVSFGFLLCFLPTIFVQNIFSLPVSYPTDLEGFADVKCSSLIIYYLLS